MESVIRNCKHCNKVATHIVDERGEETCTQCGQRVGSESLPPLEERAELEISPGISSQATVNPTASPVSFSIEELNKKVDKQFEVIKKIGSQYQVQSKKGKNLGTYRSKKAAGKRLGQVEWFKAHKKESLERQVEEWDRHFREI
jgi:hypothetical protein